MGLDFSIDLHIKNKKTGDKREIELAYWRKAYGLRDTMMDIASRNYIRADDDYLIECPTVILESLFEDFGKIFFCHQANEWTDSIWGAARTRAMTLKEFEKLAVVDSLYNDDIIDPEEACDDAANVLGEDYDIFYDTIEHPEDYEVTIVFYNSY